MNSRIVVEGRPFSEGEKVTILGHEGTEPFSRSSYTLRRRNVQMRMRNGVLTFRCRISDNEHPTEVAVRAWIRAHSMISSRNPRDPLIFAR